MTEHGRTVGYVVLMVAAVLVFSSLVSWPSFASIDPFARREAYKECKQQHRECCDEIANYIGCIAGETKVRMPTGRGPGNVEGSMGIQDPGAWGTATAVCMPHIQTIKQCAEGLRKTERPPYQVPPEEPRGRAYTSKLRGEGGRAYTSELRGERGRSYTSKLRGSGGGVSVESIRAWGTDLSDGSAVCFYTDYPDIGMSDDPGRCNTSWHAENATWRGSHRIDGNRLILGVHGLTSKYAPDHKLGIGYSVTLSGGSFEDGSRKKNIGIYRFSGAPSEQEITVEVPVYPDK